MNNNVGDNKSGGNSKRIGSATALNLVMAILTAISITVAIMLGISGIRESSEMREAKDRIVVVEKEIDKDLAPRILTLENNYEMIMKQLNRVIDVVEKQTGTR